MIRPFLGFLGIVTALVPERIIEIYEDVALENPDECTVKSWISPGIRVEGAVVTLASLTGGRAYAWMMNLTGVFGVFLLLFPERYRTVGATLLYEQPEEVEWNDRFAEGIRLIGVIYLLWAVREFQKRRGTD